MEGEDEGGPRLSKRFSDKGGEVDYKTKAGTAWSHSYLNQKPWHPLSYPNQRRKWIAEQTHAQRQRRSEEVAREYSQEQEFFRQTSLISKKEKEKVELMQAVSFMYVRPPGYNAESAKAAEIAAERRKEEQDNPPHDQGTSSPSRAPEQLQGKEQSGGEKKKPRPKDVFGRAVPTEEEFEILKNAPRLETGVAGRAKPFGVEVRNVKCLRCGTFGHQSGDRECPLKDAIMPNEQNRLKRDDPLNAIIAHTDPSEPLKWELKQRPGISPPRGGFNHDDPNQQIVADDIFDEYGGFLAGDDVPELLANFSFKPSKKKSKKKKHKKRHHRTSDEDGTSAEYEERNSKKKKLKKNKGYQSDSSLLETSESDGHRKKLKQKYSQSSDDSDHARHKESKKHRQKVSYSYEDSEYGRHSRSKRSRHKHSHSSEESDPKGHRSIRSKPKLSHSYKGYDSDTQQKRSSNQTVDADSDRYHVSVEYRHKQSHSRVPEKPVPKRHHSSGHHRHRVPRHEHSGSE